MKTNVMLYLLIAFIVTSMVCTSCRTTPYAFTYHEGPEAVFTFNNVEKMKGFVSQRRQLLRQHGISESEFIRMSTDSAWHLSANDRERLRELRLSIPKPDSTVLLQKILSLWHLPRFVENQEKGHINGFVAVAADVCTLHTFDEIYNGLRFDYADTPFNVTDSAYLAIRFYDAHADELIYPFCEEMGGSMPHEWPCSGGGFTTSTLGKGGFPEWQFDGGHMPKEGAELYMISREGKETLYLVYRDGKWRKP